MMVDLSIVIQLHSLCNMNNNGNNLHKIIQPVVVDTLHLILVHRQGLSKAYLSMTLVTLTSFEVRVNSFSFLNEPCLQLRAIDIRFRMTLCLSLIYFIILFEQDKGCFMNEIDITTMHISWLQ